MREMGYLKPKEKVFRPVNIPYYNFTFFLFLCKLIEYKKNLCQNEPCYINAFNYIAHNGDAV